MMRAFVMTLGILIVVTAGLFSLYRTYAQSPLIFGGFIESAVPCPCNNAFLLTLSPPTAGQWVWFVGTPQFAFTQLPRPGVWTLGLYSPGGVCLSGVKCTPIGAPIGTIGPITGTSL